MSVQYDPSTGSPYWAPPPSPPRRAGALIAAVVAAAVLIGTIVTVIVVLSSGNSGANVPGPTPLPVPAPAPSADPNSMPNPTPVPAPSADPQPNPGPQPHPAPGANPAPNPAPEPNPAPGPDPAPNPAPDPNPAPNSGSGSRPPGSVQSQQGAIVDAAIAWTDARNAGNGDLTLQLGCSDDVAAVQSGQPNPASYAGYSALRPTGEIVPHGSGMAAYVKIFRQNLQTGASEPATIPVIWENAGWRVCWYPGEGANRITAGG